jgi:farnesol dehydrogenase
MKQVFITGASGFIGGHLAQRLAVLGTNIHVLLRKTSRNGHLLHSRIRIIDGDLLDVDRIRTAMTGCSHVVHLAGLAKMWTKDPHDYFRVNVSGTKNVLDAASDLNVEKIIVTSTAGVFPPAVAHPSNEESLKRPQLFTEYEKSKNQAEELAIQYFKTGLPVLIVNPTKVYGPGPVNDSNTATMMVRDYLSGRWRFIPGDGNGKMNYVYIDDVVEGIISALDKAPPGSQYILGGENASYDQFFDLVKKLSGLDRRLFHLPYALIRSIAWFGDLKAALGSRPFITSEWIKKLPFDWSKDISKATRDLDYHPRSLREGLKQTIMWLHKTGGID